MKPSLIFSLIILALATLALGKPSYPPELRDAREEVYKTIGDTKLKLWIFEPEGHKKSDKRPAVVFFFGGGWRAGTPGQFEMQCKYLASRGMVAITADYRVSSRNDTKATACVEDGKSAVRWIRKNARTLGVNSAKVAAGGGSAGGHVAAAIATVPGFEKDEKTSSVPNALLLFNPALILAEVPGKFEVSAEKMASRKERIGTDPQKISPYHHVRKGLAPTIIFHGTNDDAVPFRTVQLYEKQAQALGNSCKLVAFEGKPHGFFNWGRFDNESFRETMLASEHFLAKLGWIKGKSTINAFIERQAK
ncbi:MAG: alpha/beta hydrolase [Opitutae bacterium]|nr:alpha/beta hydrolase [Opitutae bacterium]